MNVVVLGAGGFIGRAVVSALADAGHAVRAFSRLPVEQDGDLPGGERIAWLSGDVLDQRQLCPALEGADLVIHLATPILPGQAHKHPAAVEQSTLSGTRSVLEAMRGQGVNRIILASSGGTVYGHPEALPIAENHPLKPCTAAGRIQLAEEGLLAHYAGMHGLCGQVLRLANPYGEGQRFDRGQGVLTGFIARVIAGQCVDIYGDGCTIRDYLHIADAAEAFARLVEYQGASPVFNIGSGQGLGLLELVATLERHFGQRISVNHHPARCFDLPANVLDSSRARRELGWSAQTALADGIERTRRWLESFRVKLKHSASLPGSKPAGRA